MIDVRGIARIYQRINEIQTRIDEIRRIGRVERPLRRQNLQVKRKKYQKTFSEVLKEVMESKEKAENKHSTQIKNTEPRKQSQPKNIDEIISLAGKKFGVPEALIKAVINQESQFNPRAVSPKGAMGLMQIMPKTAELLGIKNPFDPVENIIGGAKYLSHLLNRYQNNLELALAAYNAGPGAVEKYGGIPPYPETQNYVKKVIEYYRQYSQKS